MKQERMRLELKPSKEMDMVASKDSTEHLVVRLPNRARVYYNPSEEWDKIYVVIRGAQEKKLRIKQAFKKDISTVLDKAKLDSVSFVTTKTYNSIVKKGAVKCEDIWVSEDSENIVIGCDPEFVIVNDTGMAVYADTVLDITGSDKIAKTGKWSKLGSDGPCAELRPDPSTDVEVVVENIKELLKNKSDIIKNYKWIGGASFKHNLMDRRYIIGGHIHLGRPNDVVSKDKKQNITAVQRVLCRILDEVVGIPMIRIDTPMPEERRKEYGKFGDVRDADNRVEWRVPSGIWLVHPTVANAVISTTKAVAEEVWKRYKDRDLSDDFMLNLANNDNIINSFRCLPHETARSILNESRIARVPESMIQDFQSKLKKMSTYHKYKDQIDLFFRLCYSKNMPIGEKYLELRNGWLNNKTIPI